MMTDAAFLAAIAASPADRTPRLAYADWLMERNDPRGRLIAVEELMRDTPVVAGGGDKVLIRGNTIQGNVASGDHGGGIWVTAKMMEIDGNVIGSSST